MNLRQVETWYGPPGSLAASQRGTDITLIGPSEESLLSAASFIVRGRSVGIVSGPIVHRILLHPANSTIPHDAFYRALAIGRPSVPDDEIWNDRGDKLFILGWKQESAASPSHVVIFLPRLTTALVRSRSTMTTSSPTTTSQPHSRRPATTVLQRNKISSTMLFDAQSSSNSVHRQPRSWNK